MSQCGHVSGAGKGVFSHKIHIYDHVMTEIMFKCVSLVVKHLCDHLLAQFDVVFPHFVDVALLHFAGWKCKQI